MRGLAQSAQKLLPSSEAILADDVPFASSALDRETSLSVALPRVKPLTPCPLSPKGRGDSEVVVAE